MSIGAAIIYGIVHDQFTAHICVEYFSVAHPPVFNTEDPTLLAIGWGIIATWWVGLLLGTPLAIAARAGKRNKRDVKSLVRPIAALLLLMGISAAIAGFVGWYLARTEHRYIRSIDQFVTPDRRNVFMADVWAHNTSYLVGFLGGCALIAYVVWSRFRARQLA